MREREELSQDGVVMVSLALDEGISSYTGGDSIWLSPGIQILPFRGSMVDLKVQVPVWERVNGTQLVSDYRVLASVSYAF